MRKERTDVAFFNGFLTLRVIIKRRSLVASRKSISKSITPSTRTTINSSSTMAKMWTDIIIDNILSTV